MRKPAGIAAVVSAALFFCACGGTYPIEKALWRADRLKKEIANSPDITPTGLFEKALGAYRNLILQYPDSPQAVSAKLSIGDILVLQGKPQEAEAAYREVIAAHPDRTERCAEALFAVSKIKEKAGDAAAASALCKEIQDRYPLTLLGLQMPLHLARKERSAKSAGASRAYASAMAVYEGVIQKHPKSPAGLLALDLLFQCHADQRNWGKAITVLQKVRDDYPGTPEAARALRMRVFIIDNLKDKKPADAKTLS
jgi:TolA-binding protein